MPAMLQIRGVTLMLIGLTLKRKVAIGIALPQSKSNEPFQHISRIERHNGHLEHLCRVYAFMVNQLLRQVHARMHKKHSQQIDCVKVTKRDMLRPDNSHRAGKMMAKIVILLERWHFFNTFATG